MDFLEFLTAKKPKQKNPSDCKHTKGTEHSFAMGDFIKLSDYLTHTIIEGGETLMLAGGEIGFDFKKKTMLLTTCDECGKYLPVYREMSHEKAVEIKEMLKEIYKNIDDDKKLEEEAEEMEYEKESFKEFLEMKAMNAESELGPDPQTCEHTKKRERVYPLTDLKELMERNSSRLWVFESVMSGKLDVTPFGVKVLKCSNCDELLPIREEINATLAGELIRLAVEGCTLKAPQGWTSKAIPLEKSEETVEKVVHPGHYQLGELGIEAMDVMRAVLTREEMQGFYKANAIKYILRANKKNGLEDIKKAHYYLNELLKEEEDEVKNNIY